MNIFFVHAYPAAAAEALCDKHVGKMLIESAQLLSTAKHLAGHPVRYRPTHKNHPCAVWVRLSRAHYNWVFEHAAALGQEFQQRYGKLHATEAYLWDELSSPVGPDAGFCAPPQCMPEEFQGPDPVDAYRAYYRSKAAVMQMRWSFPRNAPHWFNQEESEWQPEEH